MQCRRCNDPLVAGDNWQPGYVRRGNRLCKSCNTAMYMDWRNRNLDKARGVQRRYVSGHREQKREAERLRRSLNIKKERERERIKDRKRTEEGKRAAACALRRLRMKGNGLPASTEERKAIQNLYSWARWWTEQSCGFVKYHVDHAIPVARGGAHSLYNLCIMLASVNQSKGAKLQM